MIIVVYLSKINKTKDMKATDFTYEGETLISLKGQLKYINDALSQELANWERKEFECLKKDCEYKINDINERISLYCK